VNHLKLFEDFEETRDLFGLWHTITLSNGFQITGPSEYSKEAEKIAGKIELELLKMDSDNYSGHEKILASWDSTLEDYGYTHPEYKVAVISHAPDGSSVSIFLRKEYVTIEPETEEEAEDGNWWTNEIRRVVKSLGATHVYDFDGEAELVPVSEY